MKRFFLTWLALCLLGLGEVSGQYKMTPQQYIETYRETAISNMKHHGIPASITLAQGLLESGNGGSRLAVEANNHFGIKCKSSWTGDRIYHDDDAKGECFRKYPSAADSYSDHSLFLTSSPRYAALFKLQPTDYKGWARGLKAAGYATNPQYAEALISLIERYELAQYDTGTWHTPTIPLTDDQSYVTKKLDRRARAWGRVNGRVYVVTIEGDTYGKLASMVGLTKAELLSYNDLRNDSSDTIAPDSKLFTARKKGRAAKGTDYHIAQAGQTDYQIAQLHGIRLKALRRMNPWLNIAAVKEGQILRLR